MADDGPSKFLTQAEFARHRKVSRKSVTTWKQRGLLVLDDSGRINVEETEWRLDDRPAKYRGGVTHRPVRGPDGNSSGEAPPKPEQPKKGRPADPGEEGDDEPEADLDLESPTLSLAQAARRKENFLGLQRKQQFEKDDKALVDRSAAIKLFFDTARDNRDAWTSWPSRVATSMADELQVEPRLLDTVLTAHVMQHLAELGEPSADL